MKDVVTLLGTVIQHLEQQAKPPPPKIATRDELYPELQRAVVDVTACQRVEAAPPPPTRSSWRAIFGRTGRRPYRSFWRATLLRTQHHDTTPPPIWEYMTRGHHWFQQHQLEAWGGLAALFVTGLIVKTPSAGGARSSRHMAPPGGPRARGTEVRAVAGPWRGAGGHGGDVWMDDRETHDLLLAPTGSGKDTFHINPTLQWGWTQSTLNLDCQHGEMYDATHAVRGQYGRVEAFAPYRSPMACINVRRSVLGKPEEFRDALFIRQSLTAPEKMRQESSGGVHFRELAAVTIAAAKLHVGYTTSQASLAAVWHFLTQHGTFADALKDMRTTQHTSHGIHQAIAEMSGLLGKIGSGDELGSAWSTTLRPLLLYLDPMWPPARIAPPSRWMTCSMGRSRCPSTCSRNPRTPWRPCFRSIASPSM